MKKRTIVFGSMLAVFLMLMIPNVSAVEYNTVKESVEANFYGKIQENTNKLTNALSLSVGESVKKILTVFLFIIETVYSVIYYVSTPLFFKIFEPFLEPFIDSLMENNPVLGIIFMVPILFGLPFLMIQPLDSIQELINNIGAWNQTVLSNIHILIMLGTGGIISLLEFLEIIDLYSHIPAETVQ